MAKMTQIPLITAWETGNPLPPFKAPTDGPRPRMDAEHEDRLNQIQELIERTVLTPAEQEKLSALVDAASWYEKVFYPVE